MQASPTPYESVEATPGDYPFMTCEKTHIGKLLAEYVPGATLPEVDSRNPGNIVCYYMLFTMPDGAIIDNKNIERLDDYDLGPVPTTFSEMTEPSDTDVEISETWSLRIETDFGSSSSCEESLEPMRLVFDELDDPVTGGYYLDTYAAPHEMLRVDFCVDGVGVSAERSRGGKSKAGSMTIEQLRNAVMKDVEDGNIEGMLATLG